MFTYVIVREAVRTGPLSESGRTHLTSSVSAALFMQQTLGTNGPRDPFSDRWNLARTRGATARGFEVQSRERRLIREPLDHARSMQFILFYVDMFIHRWPVLVRTPCPAE